MRHTLRLSGRLLATGLLIATGLSSFGCGDTASVGEPAALGNLSVSDGTLEPPFNPATTGYTVQLSIDLLSTTITATPRVAGDTIRFDNQQASSQTITLPTPGEQQTVTIVVTDTGTGGTSKSYTVQVKRANLNGNNSLDSLGFSPGALAPTFDANTLRYTASVANSVDTVNITPTPSDSAATMTVNGQASTSGQTRTVNLNDGGQATTIPILITAQDGSTKSYEIVVSRGASSNNNLQGLATAPGILDPSFRATRTGYTVNLPATLANNVTSVRITPRLQDATASMSVNGTAATSGQAQTTPLPAPGSNFINNIVVVAQNGTTKVYTVNVVRAPLGGNNDLRNITVSPGSFDSAFNANDLNYTVDVASTVASIRVTPTLDDPAATLTVTANGPGPITTSGQTHIIPLRDAGLSTTITIAVRAPNGSIKPYTITVDRAAPPPPSGNNNLSALTVRLSTSSPNLISFSPNTTIYTVDVASTVASIRVTPTLDDPAATLTVTANGPGPITTSGQTHIIPLRDAGLSTTITIAVRAPNGSIKPYTITVDRAAPPLPSGNNNLQSLTVSPGTLSPSFSTTRARTDYAVNDVNSSATAITVTAIPQDSNATVEINNQGGNSRSIPLTGGPSTTEIEVRVIAPNGTDRTYSMTVTQPEPAAPPAPPASEPDLIAEDDSCPLLEPPSPENPDPDGCVPGTSRSDNITTFTTPRFRIPQPGPGQTPNLYVDGTRVGSIFDQAANTLQPTTPLSGDNEGIQHSITSTVTNTATNRESNPSDSLTVTISTGQSGV
ncbi:MAG: cadherin-like beta sandwich domain-containing protein [Nitrospira sp.]|nr:cadherin-like beta sandwich domain-containing protein [Nitrospira sp.]